MFECICRNIPNIPDFLDLQFSSNARSTTHVCFACWAPSARYELNPFPPRSFRLKRLKSLAEGRRVFPCDSGNPWPTLDYTKRHRRKEHIDIRGSSSSIAFGYHLGRWHETNNSLDLPQTSTGGTKQHKEQCKAGILLEIRYSQSPSYWGAFCVYNLTSCTLFPYAYNEIPTSS